MVAPPPPGDDADGIAPAGLDSIAVDAELRSLYRALPLGVAFISPDLRFLRVNEALAALHGLAAEEHIGAAIRAVLGDRAGVAVEAVTSVIATGEPTEREIELPDGFASNGAQCVEAGYFPVTGDGGELLGVGVVVRDVTERRRLERARAESLHEAGRGAARIAFLAEAGRRMAESIDWETTLQAVVHSAVPTIADWTSLTLVEPRGGLRVLAVAHSDPAREQLAWEFVARFPPDPAADSGASRVIRTGEVEIVEDLSPEVVRAAAEDAHHLRLLENLNVRHYAIVPVPTPSGVIGALTFVLGDTDRRFTAADLQLMTSLGARAGLHIQNARLYAQRSHVAEVLQASLRPKALPDVPGLEIAAGFRPAGDGIDVGGDFYDVFPGRDGAWTAIIGDVAGKGPEAAAVTAQARHTLRTASLLDDSPASNLALLNRALHAEGTEQHLCTVFSARLWSASGEIECRYANGGHPRPLLLRRDGRLDTLSGGRGPLVGAFPEAHFAEGRATLGAGDLLLMFTDGVTEIRPSDAAFGEDQLRRVVRSVVGCSAGETVTAILDRVLQLQDGEPRDDIAVLAVRAR